MEGNMKHKELYLDNAATTFVSNVVKETIMQTMDIYGNPSSVHSVGQKAKQIIDNASRNVSKIINCKPEEIIFTSGACEANSLAIVGFLRKYNTTFVTTKIEHSSIGLIADKLEKHSLSGCKSNVRYVQVDNFGRVDMTNLEQICKEIYDSHNENFLVSIQGANSEIGTCQDIYTIGKIVHKYHGIFHTDYTQAFAMTPPNVKLYIDMLSMSGQKLHSPKGIGFLFKKKGIDLEPLIYGTQMYGVRGGTENVPYIAGLSCAISSYQYKNNDKIKNIIAVIRHEIEKNITDVIFNGSLTNRLPNNLNMSFKGINSESLLMALDTYGICVSAGSACNAGSTTPSPTLRVIKVPDDYINGTIRVTVDENLSNDDIQYFVQCLTKIVKVLRNR